MRHNHHIEEISVDASWQHRLHTDAERRDLKADHLAPTLNRPLGGEIGRTEGQGDGRGDRRGVYEESRPLFPEIWKKGPGHADRAHQVRVELANHLLVGHAFKGSDNSVTG